MLIVGILIAVLAGGMTYVVSSGSKSADAPPPVATTDVLVAARDLPARSALTAADVKLAKYPVDLAPPTALTKPEEITGKIAQTALAAGEPILPGKFATAGAASFTVFPPNNQPPAGQPIPPGTPDYRAMSVTVADALAAGGFIQVGDLVDVLFTFNLDPAKFFTGTDPNRLPDFSSKIVLQNIPIIARTASVYTIRTDAQTAEAIAYLQAAGGTMNFLLRAGQDQRQASTTGVTFGAAFRKFTFPVPGKIAP
ncbi:MAG: RcpC/CpaB family pilus assembly protein [Chloroflexota bacterium]